MVTMTMERPIALLYSMISGRKPMVIMVVPKPSALCTQDPARITTITYKIAKTDIVYSLRQMKNSSDYCSIIHCYYERFSVRGKNSEEIK